MNKIITVLGFLVLNTIIGQAQNDKIIKFYDTKIGSGYHSIGTDNATIGDSILIFQMWSDEHGYELWRTNGTGNGTYMVKDINPTRDSYDEPRYSSPEYFSSFKDEVYFRAVDGEHGYELWKTDGTEEGTVMVKDICSGASGSMNPSSSTKFVEYKNELYFAAQLDYDTGLELWKTDGTEAGTVMVKDIYIEERKSSKPQGFVIFNDLLFFTAETASNYPEIWYTDGTNEGSNRLSELPKEQTPKAKDLMVFNEMLIFKGELDNGLELWKTDGTSAGTQEIKDIYPGIYYGIPSEEKPVACNGVLYFNGQTAESGYELWKTDGTEAGTLLVKDINPGTNGSLPNSSSPSYLTVFDNKVFFSAKNNDTGTQLWVSDGTEEGTVLFYGNKDMGTWNPRNLLNFNSRFYFTINTSIYGQPYLYSIGSSSETPVAHQAQNFVFTPYNRTFGTFFTLKNTLCFQAELEDYTGFELYKLIKEDVTGISLLDMKAFRIYPNPTSNLLSIDLGIENVSAFEYVLYNNAGQQILKDKVIGAKKATIDLSSYKSGIYFLKLGINNQQYSESIILK